MFDFVTNMQHAVLFICVLLFGLVVAVVVAAGVIADAIFRFQVMLNTHLQNLTELFERPLRRKCMHPKCNGISEPYENRCKLCQKDWQRFCEFSSCTNTRETGSGYCKDHRPPV